MHPTRVRAILALLALPLCAFTCFPQPNSILAVRTPPTSASFYTYPETEEGAIILDKLRSFAKAYELQESTCVGLWPSRNENAPCFAFMRFGTEGIGAFFLVGQRSQRWEVLLIKEYRVFGKYSTREVKAAFDETVREPITKALGPSIVIE